MKAMIAAALLGLCLSLFAACGEALATEGESQPPLAVSGVGTPEAPDPSADGTDAAGQTEEEGLPAAAEAVILHADMEGFITSLLPDGVALQQAHRLPEAEGVAGGMVNLDEVPAEVFFAEDAVLYLLVADADTGETLEAHVLNPTELQQGDTLYLQGTDGETGFWANRVTVLRPRR